MSVINIICSGNHGAHLSVLAKLLKLDHRLICPPCTWNTQYEDAYAYAVDKLKTESGEPQETLFWKWYVENQVVYSPYMPADYDIFVDSDSSLEQTVLEFLGKLHDLEIITGLHLWLTSSFNNRAAIKKTWERIIGNTPSVETIEYWNERTGRVLKYRIDFFSWMMILYFCKEGKKVGVHTQFYNLFKPLKWSLPIAYPLLAICLSGHARNFVRGNREFIDYIYTDVFIHTWSTLERRMTPVLVDAGDLEKEWEPVGLEVEELTGELKAEFSLIGKRDLLYFSMHQHDADPSIWENADLYSMHKVGVMIREYEVLKGKLYDGICRLPFIYDLTNFDVLGIFDKITKDVFWMPPGGCTSCNREFNKPICSPLKAHDEHINKLYAYWMFGKRDIIMLALDLYLDVNALLNEAGEQNYQDVVKHKKFGEIVYIYGKENTRQHHTGESMELFNKPNLLRIQMRDYYCVGCNDIVGTFPRFELDLHADGW